MKKVSLSFDKGWQAAVGAMRPPFILSITEADDLLKRCEDAFCGGPANKRVDMLVPVEMLHELLIVWKIGRQSIRSV